MPQTNHKIQVAIYPGLKQRQAGPPKETLGTADTGPKRWVIKSTTNMLSKLSRVWSPHIKDYLLNYIKEKNRASLGIVEDCFGKTNLSMPSICDRANYLSNVSLRTLTKFCATIL